MSHIVGTGAKLSSTYSDRESEEEKRELLDRSSIHTRSYEGKEPEKKLDDQIKPTVSLYCISISQLKYILFSHPGH